MKKLTKVVFTFKIEDGEMPRELEGMRFGDMLTKVMKKNNEIIQRIRFLTGDTKYSKYVEEFLTKDERMYLTMGQMFKKMSQGEIEK